MRKEENKFGKKVDEKLRSIPGALFFNIDQRATRGTPDRIGVISGTFVALELKKDEKEINKRDNRTRLQAYKLQQIRDAGGFGEFCYPGNWPGIYRDLLRLAIRELKKT